jgi:hypothetical protein
LAISGLHWALGTVVLVESVHYALSPFAAHEFAPRGLPHWIRPMLAGSEIIAALLFLVSGASLAGGYALLFIFIVAAVIHILHGEYDVGNLIVYGMAIVVCVTHRD